MKRTSDFVTIISSKKLRHFQSNMSYIIFHHKVIKTRIIFFLKLHNMLHLIKVKKKLRYVFQSYINFIFRDCCNCYLNMSSSSYIEDKKDCRESTLEVILAETIHVRDIIIMDIVSNMQKILIKLIFIFPG